MVHEFLIRGRLFLNLLKRNEGSYEGFRKIVKRGPGVV